MPWVLLWSYALLGGLAPTAATGPTLAVAAMALLAVVLAAAVAASSLPRPGRTPGLAAPLRRALSRRLPRLIDPDAAGRPRPRAPGVTPAA